MKPIKESKIAVVGLGYVGLPLAICFGEKFETIGYDLNKKIVDNYKRKVDPTGEISEAGFNASIYLTITDDPTMICKADYIIVAVPTPIDDAHHPDLNAVKEATKTVGKHMKKGAVVVFESTVYPGVTEDICVPILQKESRFIWKRDFHVGYSPERINPGDTEHMLPDIVKVVSGDDDNTTEALAKLYGSIVRAGVHCTKSIKEAEAAKVIENTQRDLNIALMNELAVIFDKLGIDTKNILEAAGTKWNFLPFKPGLVGGHCIGVDPYYLTYKAETVGYHPDVILAGRRINDYIGKFVAEKTVKMMINSVDNIKNAKVGVLGITFKEDCPDFRNTRALDIVKELESYGISVLVHDPLANYDDVKKMLGISLVSWDEMKYLSALIIAVPHEKYRKKQVAEFADMLCSGGFIIDVKSILDLEEVEKLGIKFWRL